jgi:hypothetical protein
METLILLVQKIMKNLKSGKRMVEHILKVDTIQDQSGNNIINENADTITIGASGDTISIPAGATLASRINTTPDNSTYSQVSSNYGSLVSGAYGNAECNYMFDVTNTSTHKVKFNLAQNQNGTPLFLGSTDENQTYATFIRLGDT